MPVLCWESSPRFAVPQSRCSALSDSAGTNFQLCLAHILQKIRIPGISWNPYFFGGLPLWIFQFLTARESPCRTVPASHRLPMRRKKAIPPLLHPTWNVPDSFRESISIAGTFPDVFVLPRRTGVSNCDGARSANFMQTSPPLLIPLYGTEQNAVQRDFSGSTPIS